MPEEPIGSALQKASAGLLYPSESDVPFDFIDWGKGWGNLEEAIAKNAQSDGVSKQSLDEFISELEESDDYGRYCDLRDELTRLLSGVRVFRCGKIRVDVYVIGKTKDGHILGLHTVSIET